MTISIIQPSFLPWPGYFAMIKSSDTFILYDNVQYDKHGWRNRNRIVSGDQLSWITVPVITKNRFGQKINETPIDYTQKWKRKLLGQLHQSYGKTPYFEKYYSWIDRRFSENHEFISSLDKALTEDICGFLNITTRRFEASHLALPEHPDKVERIISMVKAFNGTRYLSGPAAKAYISTDEDFIKNGIVLDYFVYEQKSYPQSQKGQAFIPFASTLDLLFNQGEASSEYV